MDGGRCLDVALYFPFISASTAQKEITPMNKTVRMIGYIVCASLAIALAGWIGILKSVQLFQSPAPTGLADTVVPLAAPPYDASKPTVVIVLGNSLTEATDFLGPYAMFAASGAYNVYAVAASNTLRTLTGGLDVVPQLSFAELATQLQGAPDIIVVPAMNDVEAPQNVPVLDWLRQHGHGQTILFSWCAGAEVLAASGLIDGKSVTTHWGNIDGFERTYAAVNWQRGQRYIDLIDSDRLLTTGGLTSGIDATLHLLTRLNGTAVATKVAQILHLPDSPFVENPHMPQYTSEIADSIFLLDAAFTWPKRQTGVWLYDGVGELDLAAVVDVYAVSAMDQMYSVANVPSVVSRYGLQLVPRWQAQELPALDRLLIAGGVGAEQVAQNLPTELGGAGVSVTLLQNDQSPAFAFTLALEDFAREHDVASAMFAAKRLEVRSPLKLIGSQWPLHLLIIPVLAGLTGGIAFAGLAWLSRRRFAFGGNQTRFFGTAPKGQVSRV
jgi:AraC family transcriptional activator FtrA